MDLANDALAELDLVIASVHSHMNMEAAEMTDRLLRALECPHVRILGHPTGRLLLHRDPFPFDFERVAAEAVRRGVWLEINASPERLDLHGALIRAPRPRARVSPFRPTRTTPSSSPTCATASSRRAAAGSGRTTS
jgi:DNA polymerase (family 10)